MLPGWRVGGFSCWPGRVYVACAPGLALRWPAGVCVCAYGFRVCLVCGICCHWEKSPAIPGPDRRAIGAAWWSWCLVDRWPGLLPVLAAWCGRSCGRVCAYSPGGGCRGALWRGLWGCCLLWIVCRSAWESTEILQKNSPKKRPQKNFSKNFPLWGNGLRREFFCKKGVDNRTQQCYALATTAARNSATQTQNGGTKP